MSEVTQNPPHPARWWRRLEDGRLQCELCPRLCRLGEGQRGFCFGRMNQGGRMVLTSYGRSSGLAIDPIEKKPLYHYFPGSRVLSFGTAGCNLGCRFCQNWSISTAGAQDRLSEPAAPAAIARAAAEQGCRSVAFTYNEPIIFAEYALDTAAACRELGIRTVAVTAGSIAAAARPAFFAGMDAANIDLKGFSDKFYREMCLGRLEPVLETLEFVARETGVWLELTTLLIPGHNDSDEELERMGGWVAERLGVDVPLHFTAFHPDHRLRDVCATPTATLARARGIARAQGLRHVYIGNAHDPDGMTTWCPGCGRGVIERAWSRVGARHLVDGRCVFCSELIPGHF